jgi:hypothetical protein
MEKTGSLSPSDLANLANGSKRAIHGAISMQAGRPQKKLMFSLSSLYAPICFGMCRVQHRFKECQFWVMSECGRHEDV